MRRFAGPRGKIDTIVDSEWSTNNCPECLAQGCSHAFTLTFRWVDHDGYQPSPDHTAFADRGRRQVTVVNYWANADAW